ncbi:hypothetical protein CCACVL1_24440 [Corchorus capsularis]|uniref:Uncharacterized protein n=1 Tax=Corchorus capsularis TaxID=210143 RepID=A0A1R3GPQ6_COCAP|nr:hypothetical protein CCACVL1_24440 [Corchorus capsularis]
MNTAGDSEIKIESIKDLSKPEPNIEGSLLSSATLPFAFGGGSRAE